MSKAKRAKFTVTVTPERSHHNQPFVQTESELIEARLEALADGLMKLTTFYTRVITSTAARLMSSIECL